MKLSTRSRYGARMMIELALNYGKAPLVLRDIAERQEISEKYLSKLIIPLKSARLIIASRGSHGGYILARDPLKITMREIVETLEGDISPVECVKNKNHCARSADCVVREVWCGFDHAIYGFLESITLESLVKKHRSGEQNEYHI